MSEAATGGTGDPHEDPHEDSEYVDPLPVRGTFREAVHTYREHFGRVVGTAILVLLPIEVLKGFLRALEQSGYGKVAAAAIAIGGLTLLETIVTTLSAAFYAGFMDRTVHALRRGEEPAPIPQIARELPYWRMIGVAIVAALMVVVGAIFLIIPGFILFTLTAIAGPVVVIEDRGVFSAIKRSITLTRHRFWRMTIVVSIPIIVEGAVLDWAARAAGHGIWAEILIHGLAAAFALAFVMLLEVHAAQWLIEDAHEHEDEAVPTT